MSRTPKRQTRSIDISYYRALAAFRYHIRQYLDFSDQAAKAIGLEPKQYQLLLAIKGLPEASDPTVGTIAKQLHIRHHSAVELINRAESNSFVRRERVGNFVVVQLTSKGERALSRAVETRLKELQIAGPVLVDALRQLIGKASRRISRRKRRSS
jgi:DNA-binding MarR family transcriptional regulator